MWLLSFILAAASRIIFSASDSRCSADPYFRFMVSSTWLKKAAWYLHCARAPAWSIILPVTDAPLTEEEKAQIRSRLHDLEVEHYDLDDVIRKLAADPAQDQLQLQRLKKRKLVLKDQIQRLRARLIPDIIA